MRFLFAYRCSTFEIRNLKDPNRKRVKNTHTHRQTEADGLRFYFLVNFKGKEFKFIDRAIGPNDAVLEQEIDRKESVHRWKD